MKPISSSSSRAAVAAGRLAVDVALARRHLEQLPVGRGAVLAHEQRGRTVGEHRHDDHRARMAHDDAPRLLAVGRLDRELVDREEPEGRPRSSA